MKRSGGQDFFFGLWRWSTSAKIFVRGRHVQACVVGACALDEIAIVKLRCEDNVIGSWGTMGSDSGLFYIEADVILFAWVKKKLKM